MRVYTSSRNALQLIGCKSDVGGKCYVQGEKKKEGCNKFICDKDAEFKAVSKGTTK